MSGPDELLSVRETARRLGVHENTVRNWARRGILPAHPLPGSGYRRFRAGDAEQLRLVIEAGRLEQLFLGTAAITTGELGQLLTVARMYLDVFTGCDQMTPSQQQLYRDIESIVARYAGQEAAA